LTAGPLLFIRYAFPPNERGFCGPPDSAAVRGQAETGTDGPGLRQLARGFAGAWPYLELIAAANGIADPLDERVVAAYWVGSALLENVRMPRAGALPHHSFHVFCVYPWAGLLRAGRVEPSLRVLDSCRISWGRVLTTDPLVVLRRPLTWDGRAFALGPPAPRPVTAGFAAGLRSGDWVSLHWDCVCDRLAAAQLRALRRYSARHLRLASADTVAESFRK
jgi:hypothetical protein